MKRSPRPRSLARRTIGSLAIAPDISHNIPLPAALIPEAVPPLVPIATPRVAAAATVRRDAMALRGELWEISYQQRKGVMADSRGLRYIALLVRDTSGGRDPIHARELTALATASPKKTAFVHAGEKARKAVAKAIAGAIGKMAAHPELSPLASHFTSSIRKGQWLSYGGSADWQIAFSAPSPRK